MQINKFLCIIYKFLRLFMKKQFMKIQSSLVRVYKLKQNFIYLLKLFFISSIRTVIIINIIK